MISLAVSNKDNRFASVEPLPELKAGHMEVRLATNLAEVEKSQALRYKVFYEECGAVPNPEAKELKRDFDAVDDFCDHLLVIDHSKGAIIGTYRLMLREAAQLYGSYYTASEFDVDKLLSMKGEIMELGRSCVHEDYRTRPTMQLLLRGVGAYCEMHKVKALFGCASFPGSDISLYRNALAYLYHHYLAPEDVRARALPELYQEINTIPKDKLDVKKAARELPPLIKGYLWMGGFIGDGAIVDKQFNTIDVCITLKTDLMTNRYAQRYRGQPGIIDKG